MKLCCFVLLVSHYYHLNIIYHYKITIFVQWTSLKFKGCFYEGPEHVVFNLYLVLLQFRSWLQVDTWLDWPSQRLRQREVKQVVNLRWLAGECQYIIWLSTVSPQYLLAVESVKIDWATVFLPTHNIKVQAALISCRHHHWEVTSQYF